VEIFAAQGAPPVSQALGAPGANLPPVSLIPVVSLTPAANLPPVSLTLAANLQRWVQMIFKFTNPQTLGLANPQLSEICKFANYNYKQMGGQVGGGEGGTLQTDAAQLYLFVPIPAKAKKLGLLSIYKFSLDTRFVQSTLALLDEYKICVFDTRFVHSTLALHFIFLEKLQNCIVFLVLIHLFQQVHDKQKHHFFKSELTTTKNTKLF
jgi:hypothetical protein